MKKKEKPVLIGLAGNAGSGKNLVAQIIRDIRGEPVVELEFSTPIKKAVAAMLGITESRVESLKRRNIAVSPLDTTMRSLLQTLGTEWGRDVVDPDIWVKLAAPKVCSGLTAGYDVLIPGVRFQNEADMIHAFDGYVIEVVRPDTGGDTHISETRALDVDAVLSNSGDILHLRREVKRVLEEVGV